MAALDPSSFGNLNLFGKCGEKFESESEGKGVPFLKVKIRSDGPDPTRYIVWYLLCGKLSARFMSSSDSDLL